MNDENLIPANKRSESERRAIAQAGGRASGRARRIKSRGKQLVLDLLAMRQPDPKVIADLERFGVNAQDLTNEVAMHLRQIDKAIRKADTYSYQAVLRAAGLDDQEITLNTNEGGIRIVDTRKPEPGAPAGNHAEPDKRETKPDNAEKLETK